ncbi:MAG: hypothetical protein AABX26_00170 [Nanoarchaeota archaeon]
MELLTKDDLLKYCQKEEVMNGYILVNRGDKREISCQLGVPSMLIRSISQFERKPIEEITFDDALMMYRAINRDLKSVSDLSLKKWRKNNNLSFFGTSQYGLLKYCLKNAK